VNVPKRSGTLIRVFLLIRGSARLADGLDLAIFVASLALYFHTLAPTVLPADSGEFQLVSATLGIAHPPGYPLYTLLGRLFTLLPLGDVAYRVNLMSAVFAALTLALVSRATRQLSGSLAAGLAAAVALGATPTFWAQATTANVRSLTALFTASLLLLLVLFVQEARGKRQEARGKKHRASCLLPPASCILHLASCLSPLSSSAWR